MTRAQCSRARLAKRRLSCRSPAIDVPVGIDTTPPLFIDTAGTARVGGSAKQLTSSAEIAQRSALPIQNSGTLAILDSEDRTLGAREVACSVITQGSRLSQHRAQVVVSRSNARLSSAIIVPIDARQTTKLGPTAGQSSGGPAGRPPLGKQRDKLGSGRVAVNSFEVPECSWPSKLRSSRVSGP